MKINAKKCPFCAIEIEHLSYVLTRDDKKTQQMKVPAILMLILLQNIKQLDQFLDMVQYYRDVGEMPSLLTDLVVECGYTDTEAARANKIKTRVMTLG